MAFCDEPVVDRGCSRSETLGANLIGRVSDDHVELHVVHLLRRIGRVDERVGVVLSPSPRSRLFGRPALGAATAADMWCCAGTNGRLPASVSKLDDGDRAGRVAGVVQAPAGNAIPVISVIEVP